MPGLETPTHLGWWPGSALDALDNALSIPVLQLELGALEYLVAVPGTWFGMPPLVWLLLPQFVGLAVCKAEEQQGHLVGHHCEEEAARGFLAVLLVATALSTVVFFHVLLRGDVHVVFTATKYILLPAAVLPPIVARYALGARAGHAVALVMCSWLATETLSHLIKITARRMRPGVALRAHLAGTSRRMPQLQRLVLAGETAFQSFPSGDAGGAFVFSYLLYLYKLEQAAWWIWMPALLSSFGRVYLHAHHVIDGESATVRS
jgi:membrane-associated phospholipid phosphatase